VGKLVGENRRFVYGIGGQLIAEFDGSTGNLKKEYVYGGATLITKLTHDFGCPNRIIKDWVHQTAFSQAYSGEHRIRATQRKLILPKAETTL
jgi:hypothetical protein